MSLDALDIHKGGRVVLAASQLTGRTWDGKVSFFCSTKDALASDRQPESVYHSRCGVADVKWLDNRRVITACDVGGVQVLRVCGDTTVELVKEGVVHDGMALRLAVHGAEALCASDDHSVSIWGVGEDVAQLANFQVHQGPVTGLQWAADGQSFWTASEDASVKLWDRSKPLLGASSCAGMARLPAPATSLVAAGGLLYCGLLDGSLVVRDWRNPGEDVAVARPHRAAIGALAASPNGRLVASGGDDNTVRVHRLGGDRGIETCYESADHSDFVRGVAFAPSGGGLVTCGWDGRVLNHAVPGLAG